MKRNWKNKAYHALVVAMLLASCGRSEHTANETEQYTCSMHPQVIQDKPGTCPICGMELVKMNGATSADGTLMLSESQIKLANITTTLTRFESMGENTILAGKLIINEEQTEVVSSRV